MEDKITIIEGPPPTFEVVADDWVWGLNEGPTLSAVVATRLRTFNGRSLVERCFNAWGQKTPIHLEYRTMEGMTAEAPIVAARSIETDDGDMLVLWVRVPNEDLEVEIGFDDDFDDEDDDMDDLDIQI